MTEYTSGRGQIPLDIRFKEKPGFDLFIPGANYEVCRSIKRIAKGIDDHNVYLWGQPGTGKSHLLHAACGLADAQQRRVAYVPLENFTDLDPELLQDLDYQDLVCIDDIDKITGQAEWEQALFHFYNRARDKNHPVLITGTANPKALALELPDLKSRVGWGLIYHLDPLDDHDKIIVLQQRAQIRGFDLPDDVADFLVKRVKRDLPGLIQLLDHFDNATLVEKRKLTVPFIKRLLEEK